MAHNASELSELGTALAPGYSGKRQEDEFERFELPTATFDIDLGQPW